MEFVYKKNRICKSTTLWIQKVQRIWFEKKFHVYTKIFITLFIFVYVVVASTLSTFVRTSSCHHSSLLLKKLFWCIAVHWQIKKILSIMGFMFVACCWLYCILLASISRFDDVVVMGCCHILSISGCYIQQIGRCCLVYC